MWLRVILCLTYLKKEITNVLESLTFATTSVHYSAGNSRTHGTLRPVRVSRRDPSRGRSNRYVITSVRKKKANSRFLYKSYFIFKIYNAHWKDQMGSNLVTLVARIKVWKRIKSGYYLRSLYLLIHLFPLAILVGVNFP